MNHVTRIVIENREHQEGAYRLPRPATIGELWNALTKAGHRPAMITASGQTARIVYL